MKNKTLIIVFSFMFLILSSITLIFAWYKDIDNAHLEINNPQYSGITFDVKYQDQSLPETDKNGLLLVIGNKVAEGKNTIEDLTVSITFTPKVTSYLRVRVEDAWQLTRTYTSSGKQSIKYVYNDNPERYLFAEGWVYDAATNFVYYTTLITKSDTPITVPFITSGIGIDTSASKRYVDDYLVSIDLFSDICQANRYQEIWGIAALPKKEVTPNA